jgi:hypothetical protein
MLNFTIILARIARLARILLGSLNSCSEAVLGRLDDGIVTVPPAWSTAGHPVRPGSPALTRR